MIPNPKWIYIAPSIATNLSIAFLGLIFGSFKSNEDDCWDKTGGLGGKVFKGVIVSEVVVLEMLLFPLGDIGSSIEV